MKSRHTSLLLSLFVLLLSQPLLAQDALALFKEGVSLKDQKKPKEALEKFKQALVIRPDYPDALYESGWCQNDLRDYTGAIINLRKARNSWSTYPKVHFELGYAFEKTGMTDSAIISYNKCIQLSPAYSGAYRQLGNIYYEKDDYSLSLEYFRNYEKNAKTPPSDYSYFYRKGYMLNASKMYDSAMVALNKSLELKKDYVMTYYELGFSATKLKQAEEAIGYFNSAIPLDPKSHIPYNGIGEVYRDVTRDMDMAMTWYSKTLQLNSNERKANYGMGYCLNSKMKYAEAIPYLRKAIASEDTYTAAYVELGYALYKTQSYTEGEIQLKKALTLNPKSENAHYYLILLYVTLRDKPNAQKWLNSLRALNSKYVAELEKKVNTL
jgi:tetratricopeptide (TPR) repeat protein